MLTVITLANILDLQVALIITIVGSKHCWLVDLKRLRNSYDKTELSKCNIGIKIFADFVFPSFVSFKYVTSSNIPATFCCYPFPPKESLACSCF